MEMVNSFDNGIAARFTSVMDEIAKAAVRTDRGGNDVTLVAVSKTFPAEIVMPVLQSGHRVFGENRVQEADEKWPQLRKKFDGIELHLIGPLQTNKAALAVGLFDCIQTLDRPKLAKVIALELKKQQKQVELFVQVNTGAESQKSGVGVEGLHGFLGFCQKELKLPVNGLMCIPPVTEDPKKHFLLLSELAAVNNLPKLSMGMSADFPLAIECGATHVRVGTAIFGHR